MGAPELTWDSEDNPQDAPLSAMDWLRVVLRALPLALVVFGGLIFLLLLRLVERPIQGVKRPWTPWITQGVCRSAFLILGMRHRIEGRPMSDAGCVVSNHASWLDIFALNARKRVYFVSKAEVATWPAIGWLARATGTVFIRRDAREAHIQTEVFRTRLKAGHRLLFFPEGTSTDGLRVLPFKSTLFAAFFDPALKDDLKIQPVSLVYHAPEGEDARFYGWWGDMEFGAHLLKTLAARHPGRVDVVYHAPLAVADFENRKQLAKACGELVQNGVMKRLSTSSKN